MRKLIVFILIFPLLLLVFSYFLSYSVPDTITVISTKNSEVSSPEEKAVSTSTNDSFYLKGLEETRKKFIAEDKDFLEADLSEMKVKVYRQGSLIKEVPIFTKGNPQRWGGTSLGRYQVLSKHQLAYSVLAGVYMPWSLHIDGKYYIHGDDYYPGGRVDPSSITGGCLRLENKYAKQIFNLSEKGMPVLVTTPGLESNHFKYQSSPEEFPSLSAQAYLVADLDSGLVFAQKNYQQQLPIASLTKLMTATVVAEIVDLRKSISVTSSMVEARGSTSGLEPGEKVRAVELFWPLLIESSNDAAEVLSYFLGRKETIELMNEKAKAISMDQTKFVDPSGLSAQNVSTPEDLFYLARYVLNARPMFLDISREKEVWSFGLPVRFKDLKNRNIFSEDPNFIGGKAGFIKASQSTGLFIFRFPLKNGSQRRIVIIGLGSEAVHGFPVNLEQDVNQIVRWLKKNYFPHLLNEQKESEN